MRTRFGPGLLVAAAFIGPGTVTTASLAGAGFGYTLAWAVVAATLATIILQEMSARLGAFTGLGLGEALREGFTHPHARNAVIALALFAITFGNAAYQSGNLTGAALGLEALAGGSRQAWVLACAVVAAVLLATGRYRVVEGVLVALVGAMGLIFLVTVLLIGPDLLALLRAVALPSVPPGAGLTVLALIGTTVVPYNLFLHAAAVREKWRGVAPALALPAARRDSAIAVVIGGLVTLAILLSAVPLYLASVPMDGVAAMAFQLEPLLGVHARYLFAAGLFAAGLTSAITAPLAAAWATAGLLGWSRDLHDPRFRAVWALIIVVGAGVALTGVRPLQAILLAQAANGLLLPLMAGFLLWVMNQPRLMGDARNGIFANCLGAGVFFFSIILCITVFYRVFLI